MMEDVTDCVDKRRNKHWSDIIFAERENEVIRRIDEKMKTL